MVECPKCGAYLRGANCSIEIQYKEARLRCNAVQVECNCGFNGITLPVYFSNDTITIIDHEEVSWQNSPSMFLTRQ